MPIETVLAKALTGALPRSLQHGLCSLAARRRVERQDEDLLQRALARDPRRAQEDWSGRTTAPCDLLTWVALQESSGPGHDWVLDSGIRKDRFGNARGGDLSLCDDAPIPGRLWLTAVRLRLLLPLGEVWHTARKAAGTPNPQCGCSLCQSATEVPSGRSRRSPRSVDIYGMHLSTVVATFTRRHHEFAALVEKCARLAGIAVHHEYEAYRTLTGSANDADKRKRVDTLLHEVALAVLSHIDPDSVSALARARGRSTGDAAVDYTWHHPFAMLASRQAPGSTRRTWPRRLRSLKTRRRGGPREGVEVPRHLGADDRVPRPD